MKEGVGRLRPSRALGLDEIPGRRNLIFGPFFVTFKGRNCVKKPGWSSRYWTQALAQSFVAVEEKEPRF
ncbi:hypothetical protein Oscil6304_2982 [Oscillatoria acuminata PCC 6304]|uniref:Uncharacterized protein n=1 Tax=Oscillatoria acuminata PCC 6304 TaxID=56110 RepID=K9TKN2_9CYAN|nr:hypothetical protein Oscil6304_2982 [Oscillatoria acuminata PCC 6304]